MTSPIVIRYEPGLWKQYYKRGMTARTPLHSLAILAYKEELIRNGCGEHVDTSKATFGIYMDRGVRKFQKIEEIDDDGVIGPITSRLLMQKIGMQYEEEFGIPDYRALRQKSWESGNDPAAVGPSGEDIGPAQIYLPDHPNVTVDNAVNIAFSLKFMCQRMVNSYVNLRDWPAAMVAHNVGDSIAGRWLRAGKPASGGPKNTKGEDLFTICSNYEVRVMGCKY